jgi:Fe2+ transport system protein FeoA
MDGLRKWWERLFPPRVRVTVDGKGYRVNGEWCTSQVDVRRHLEEMGVSESEIVHILKELNSQKYGDPNR